MRTFVQALYRILLRGIGAIGILLLVVFAMFAFTGTDDRSFLHALPLIALAALTLSSVALAMFQHRLPDCLARPSRPVHLAALLPAWTLAALITPLAAMITLTGTGAPEEMMRPLAVGSGTLFVLMYAGAGLLGLILSVWAKTPARNDPMQPA